MAILLFGSLMSGHKIDFSTPLPNRSYIPKYRAGNLYLQYY
ncbi:MAG: hypothetical protein CI952_1583, partial [Methanohalophilus sp.]